MTSPYSFDQCVCILSLSLSLSPMHSYTHTHTDAMVLFPSNRMFFFFCAHYLETRVLVESW